MNHRRKLIVAITAILLLLIGLALLRLVPTSAVDRHLAELRAAGTPVTPGELDRWYTHLPADDNMALIIQTAVSEIRLSPARSALNSGSIDLRAGSQISEEHLAMLDEHLSNNLPALGKLRPLLPTGTARHPVDLTLGVNFSVGYLADLKAASQLLRQDSAYAAQTGDSGRAARAIIAGFAVANSLRDEPTLISQLVRYTCSAITERALEFVLSNSVLSEDQLVELNYTLLQIEAGTEQSLWRALVGERVIGLSTFELAGAQLLGRTAPGGASFEDVIKGVALDLQRALGVRQWDKRLYVETMHQLAEAAALPYLVRAARLKAAGDEAMRKIRSARSFFATLTRMIIPSIVKAGEKEAIRLAALRCARTALAAERFRLKHERLPANTAELVPAFLNELPRDPVDDRPLELELLSAQGYFVRARATSAYQRVVVETNRPPGVGFLVVR